MAKPKKAKPESTPPQSGADIPAAMRQLAQILAHFEKLSPSEEQSLLAAYSDDDCLARGRVTRSDKTFNDAMNWARTVGEHKSDPAVSPKSARWMLDCLATLGTIRSGETPAATPSGDGAIAQATSECKELYDDVLGRVHDNVGRNAAWNAQLADALAAPSKFDPRVAAPKALAQRIASWLDAKSGAPVMSIVNIDRTTVAALEAAAKRLDEALAKKPAAKTLSADSPAINIAEGRLYFAMRVVWNDFARARNANKSKLLLTVTPTLLRGMDIAARKKGKSVEPVEKK